MANQNNNLNVIASEERAKQSAASQPSLRGDVARNEAKAISSKEPKKLIPKLRFKEFEGEWEKKSLKNITKINQGLQIAISERFTEKVEGSHFYITNEFLRAGSSKKYFIKNPTESVMCTEDDILMTRTGNTGQVVTGVKGAFHNNFFKIKFDSNCDKWFLYYFLTDYKTQQTILKLAGTSTIPDLNHSDFYRLKINLPNLPEQQKIANFLTAVDTKLQQLTTKKETLEQYKKGVMQQLFSQQLRFKPDVIANAVKQSHEANSKQSATNDNQTQFPDWEEKRLGEVGKIITGSTPSTSIKEYYDGKKLFVSPADIQGNRYVSETKTTLTELGFNKGRKVKKNSVLFVCIGSTIGKVAQASEECLTNQQLNVIEANKDNSNDFIYSLLYFKGDKIKLLAGVQAVPQINKTDFSNLKFNFPKIEEQQKIATYLSAIDTKIEAVQTQISNTQAFKKGLLQQMFV